MAQQPDYFIPHGEDDFLVDRLAEIDRNRRRMGDHLLTLSKRLDGIECEQERQSRSASDTLGQLADYLTQTTDLARQFHSLEVALKDCIKMNGSTRVHSTTTTSSSNAFSASLELSEAGMEDLEAQIRRLFQNFRGELLAHTTSSGTKFTELSGAIDRLNSNIRDLEHKRSDSVTRIDNSLSNLAAKLSDLTTIFHKNADEMKDNFSSLRRDVDEVKLQMRSLEGELHVEKQKRVDADEINLREFKTVRSEFTQQLTDSIHRHHDEIRTVTSELRQTCSGGHEKLSERLAQVHDELRKGIDTLSHTHETVTTRCLEEQERRTDEHIDLFRNYAETNDELLSKCSQSLAHLTDRMTAVESSASASALLDQQASRTESEMRHLTERLSVVEQDCEARYRRLVDSTKHALDQYAKANDNTTVLDTLRADIVSVRELHSQVSLNTESVKKESSHLVQLLADLRDWIRDVENRCASRSELESATSKLSGELALCRQAVTEFHSTQGVLGQRIETERSAREYEASDIRLQLQRFQRSPSPMGLHQRASSP